MKIHRCAKCPLPGLGGSVDWVRAHGSSYFPPRLRTVRETRRWAVRPPIEALMLPRPQLLSLAFAALLAPWLILGCKHPFRPPTGPTLQTLWPNDDGRSWNYALAGRSWTDTIGPRIYATADSVPPA